MCTAYRDRMREILPTAAAWVRSGRSFALATVVAVHGSAPRGLGASMIVGADGAIVGNVSGGCVEGAVVELAHECMASGTPARAGFGIPDDALFGLGLMCGGGIEVLVRPVRGELPELLTLLSERERLALPAVYRFAVDGAGGDTIADDAAAPDPRVVGGMLEVPVGAPARLVIVGAVEFAVALSRLALAAGRRVTVIDPRTAFLTAERFPGIERVAAWPDRALADAVAAGAVDARTAICVLSHDPKIDEPALVAALASPAGYVGAMGSRSTDADRRRRLRDAGVTAAALDRLRSPIGLDLGGRSPEETAVSILAEIIAVAHGGSGRAHRDGAGALHGATAEGGAAGDAASAVAAAAGACPPDMIPAPPRP